MRKVVLNCGLSASLLRNTNGSAIYCTVKTPGGAGTHTGHTRAHAVAPVVASVVLTFTRAHKGTRITLSGQYAVPYR